jgi:hypothetical protein
MECIINCFIYIHKFSQSDNYFQNYMYTVCMNLSNSVTSFPSLKLILIVRQQNNFALEEDVSTIQRYASF